MLVFQILGGLGNQLFQYAFARRISMLSKVPYRLDVSGFRKYKLHKYSLSKFNVIENIATAREVMPFKAWYYADRWLGRHSGRVMVESGPGFEPEVIRPYRSGYFLGYWQSARYFEGVEDVLRRELTLRDRMDDTGKRYAEKIAGVAAPVSLHVRRGDYVSNPQTNQTHGVCSVEYYRSAVKRIAQVTDNPTFFVFSDDLNWAKGNLDLGYPSVFVDSGGAEKNEQDLILMSRCRHHVIANSSFSWWGAWLNSSPEKVVVAPARWFSTAALSVTDVMPAEWVRL